MNKNVIFFYSVNLYMMDVNIIKYMLFLYVYNELTITEINEFFDNKYDIIDIEFEINKFMMC